MEHKNLTRRSPTRWVPVTPSSPRMPADAPAEPAGSGPGEWKFTAPWGWQTINLGLPYAYEYLPNHEPVLSPIIVGWAIIGG